MNQIVKQTPKQRQKVEKRKPQEDTQVPEQADFTRRDIDKRKIILKKGKNILIFINKMILFSILALTNNDTSENVEDQKQEMGKDSRRVMDDKKRLSQDEIDYLENKYNSTQKYEESKIRHKKTPAISLKNNFLETIKGFNHSTRNEDGKKIRYPKHDSNQGNNAVSNTILTVLTSL